MIVLGIETSCDETSASVVKDGVKVLSNTVASSLKFHSAHGGIIPEIASRMQVEAITSVVDLALEESGVALKNIGLISVTAGPGLSGSLLTGISFAKALSLALNIPLLGVNHVHSHIYANFLNNGKTAFPFVGLAISGGHTSLFYFKDFDKIEVLGETQDDACGEAFDKVAKLLGLGYPGGPYIEKLALKGNSAAFKFRCSGTKEPLNFSFSGIKTAVMYMVKGRRLSLREKSDIAASFQETVIDTLIKKAFLACEKKKISLLAVGGGVAVNSRLREKFIEAAGARGIKCHFPQKSFCLDNAAMVAGFGYRLYKKGERSGLNLTAQLS